MTDLHCAKETEWTPEERQCIQKFHQLQEEQQKKRQILVDEIVGQLNKINYSNLNEYLPLILKKWHSNFQHIPGWEFYIANYRMYALQANFQFPHNPNPATNYSEPQLGDYMNKCTLGISHLIDSPVRNRYQLALLEQIRAL